MKNDGRCWVHIPTDLTDPKLSEAGAGIVSALRALYDLPALIAGDTNPYYLQINRIGIARGASVEIVDALAACGPITAVERVPLELTDDILAVGGDVEGLPVFIRITDLNAVCPLGDGVETWATWGTFGQSHLPVKYGAYWYRSTAVGQSGAMLSLSQLVPVRASLVSLTQYRQIVAENTPSLP